MVRPDFYYWIGFVVFWVMAVLATLIILALWIYAILNLFARHYHSLWIIFEYAIHRKRFKEYLEYHQKINKKPE